MPLPKSLANISSCQIGSSQVSCPRTNHGPENEMITFSSLAPSSVTSPRQVSENERGEQVQGLISWGENVPWAGVHHTLTPMAQKC